MKDQERIVDFLIRQLASIDDSQFGFVPGRGTTDAVFVVRQLREYQAANKRLHGFCRPGEGGVAQKVIRWVLRKLGLDCATGAGDVCQWAEPCPCLWLLQWRIWSEGWCSPRLCTQPAALHHWFWSLAMRVLFWGPLAGPLYQWPCYHPRIALGMCQEALDLERSNGGGERTE